MGKNRKMRLWPPADEPLAGAVMDNHTHLPLREIDVFVDELGETLSIPEQLHRARKIGVTQIVTSACELPDFELALDFADQWPNVKVALAIHPNEAALHAGVCGIGPDGLEHLAKEHHIPLLDAINVVTKHLTSPNVVAVGETGLDYFRTDTRGRQAQREAFRAHLELAYSHNLPLQIHDRDAHQDTLQLLQDSAKAEQVIVFHSFSGDVHLACELAARGWYASFSGTLTYPRNERLRAALLALPKNLVLVETDAPYLPPQKYRGCPNASYVITHTVRAIARLWELPEEQTCQILLENSQRVYGVW